MELFSIRIQRTFQLVSTAYCRIDADGIPGLKRCLGCPCSPCVNFKGHGITAVDCGAFLILTALQGQEGCHGQPGEKAV